MLIGDVKETPNEFQFTPSRMEIATGTAQPIVGRDRESVVIYQVRRLLSPVIHNWLLNWPFSSDGNERGPVHRCSRLLILCWHLECEWTKSWWWVVLQPYEEALLNERWAFVVGIVHLQAALPVGLEETRVHLTFMPSASRSSTSARRLLYSSNQSRRRSGWRQYRQDSILVQNTPWSSTSALWECSFLSTARRNTWTRYRLLNWKVWIIHITQVHNIGVDTVGTGIMGKLGNKVAQKHYDETMKLWTTFRVVWVVACDFMQRTSALWTVIWRLMWKSTNGGTRTTWIFAPECPFLLWSDLTLTLCRHLEPSG